MALANNAGGKYNLAAVHGLNAYLWDGLKKTFGMSETQYDGLIPIVPSQQIPQLTEIDRPFIVYNWVTDNQGTDTYFETDQIMYLIYSTEEEEIRQIVNYMRSLFKDYDVSAQAVNTFVRKGVSVNQKRFHYKYINVLAGSGGALPTDSEGGRQESMLTISVRYTVNRADT